MLASDTHQQHSGLCGHRQRGQSCSRVLVDGRESSLEVRAALHPVLKLDCMPQH